MTARRTARRAFTLTELAVGLAIVSIVIVGLGSAIVVASKAIPGAASPAQRALQAADCVDDIAAELTYATTINAAEANAIEFVVVDRTGDATPETIRYEWSGNAGDPLTRQVNGGAVQTILEDVHAFDLTYHGPSTTEEQSGEGESAEQLLAHYAPLSWSSVTVTATDWPGQYFEPDLPANATGWRVTQVELWASSNWPPDGDVAVQVRSADILDQPTDTVLAQASLSAGSVSWIMAERRKLAVSGMANLSPLQGACVVVEHVSGDEPCNVWIDMSGFGSSSGPQAFQMTLDGGQSWSSSSAAGMIFSVYGTYTAPDILQTVTVVTTRNVTLTVQAGDERGSAIHGGARLLNEPTATIPQ